MRSLFFLAVLSAALAASLLKPVVVDLDVDPEHRWDDVIKAKKDEISSAMRLITEYLKPVLHKLGDGVADLADHFIGERGKEMRGIAKAAGVKVGDIVLLNVAGEFISGCSGILAQTPEGIVYHGRNLDWSGSDDFFGALAANTSGLMRDLAIQVTFVRGSRVQYRATTFAGYVGVLTGMVPRQFSISSNWKDPNVVYKEVFEMLLRRASLRGFFIRDLLDAGKPFQETLELCSTQHLVGPVYLILGGIDGEGAIVTRTAEKSEHLRSMTKEEWYLVQANFDWWNPNPPLSEGAERVAYANKFLSNLGSASVTDDVMGKLIRTPPVLRDSTIYSCVMSAEVDAMSCVV